MSHWSTREIKAGAIADWLRQFVTYNTKATRRHQTFPSLQTKVNIRLKEILVLFYRTCFIASILIGCCCDKICNYY